MRYIALILLPLLTGCSQPASMTEIMSRQCISDGFTAGTEEHDKCLKTATNAYEKQMAKDREAQKKADKLVVDSYKDKCRGYGIKPDQIGLCVMQLQQSDKQEALNQQQLSIQQQQANAQKTQALGSLLGGVGAIQQANRPRGMNCTSTQNGAFGNTSCY